MTRVNEKELPTPAVIERLGSETPELRRRLGLEPTAEVSDPEAKVGWWRHFWRRLWGPDFRRSTGPAELAVGAADIPRFLQNSKLLDVNVRPRDSCCHSNRLGPQKDHSTAVL